MPFGNLLEPTFRGRGNINHCIFGSISQRKTIYPLKWLYWSTLSIPIIIMHISMLIRSQKVMKTGYKWKFDHCSKNTLPNCGCLWCMEMLKKMLLIVLIYMSGPLMPDSITWCQMKNGMEYCEFKYYSPPHTLHTCTSVELYLIMFLMLIKVSWCFINPSILGHCKVGGKLMSWIWML
jgi:hypothetical protein